MRLLCCQFLGFADCFDQDFTLNIPPKKGPKVFDFGSKLNFECSHVLCSMWQYVFVVSDDDFFPWWKLRFWKVTGTWLLVQHSYQNQGIPQLSHIHQFFSPKALPSGWLRNPVKVLFVPITEAQMDELQGLSEQGSLKASVLVSIYCSSNMSCWKESPKLLANLTAWQGPNQDYNILHWMFSGFANFTPQTRENHDKFMHQLWTREWVASNLMWLFNQKRFSNELINGGWNQKSGQVKLFLMCSCCLRAQNRSSPMSLHIYRELCQVKY